MVQSVSSNLLIAAAAGGLFVISVLPLNTLFLAAWAAVAVATVCSSTVPSAQKPQLLFTHVFTFATVTLLAYLAPVKTDRAHFTERIRLPKTELTVADVQEIAARPAQDNFPVSLNVRCRQETQAQTVHFSGTDISLGDFINAVENQTPLRHRFLHCGNAYTILWGYPPSYSLLLIERDDSARFYLER